MTNDVCFTTTFWYTYCPFEIFLKEVTCLCIYCTVTSCCPLYRHTKQNVPIYLCSGGYNQPGNIRSAPVRRSSEFPENLGMAKPRSILRNSQSQSQLPSGRECVVAASPPVGYQAHQEALQSQGNIKKNVGDLRQWQQQHQQELLHQHIETQVGGVDCHVGQ